MITTASLSRAFIGRQPILDERLGVYGYELLFRSSPVNAAGVRDADGASARVVLDAFLEFGLDTLVGSRRAFINATRTFLTDGLASMLPKERVVIELLETLRCDNEVTAAVEQLAADGYELALDDYTADDPREPLLPYAAIVKLDLSQSDRRAFARQVETLARHRVALVAERVETHQDFDDCRALGCQYFQGFFFAEPMVVTGHRAPVGRLAAIRTLALLADDDTALARLEEAIASDVALSYQVLRVINSAYYGRATDVGSLREAIVLIGRDRLRGWVTLMALAGEEGRSPELLTLALVRAKMCEALGAAVPGASPAAWFTGGLLSSLDLFFSTPLGELVAALPLSADVRSAVVDRTGRLGATIGAVHAFERGDWTRARCDPFSPGDFSKAYSVAVGWAEQWRLRGALLQG